MVIFATMRKTLASTLTRLDAIEAEYKALAVRRKELEKLPMEDASPYWHAEKYLYLICRTHDGYRPRKYVGKKPEKVEAALASITRFKEHAGIVKEMQAIHNRMYDVQFLLQQVGNKLNDRSGV